MPRSFGSDANRKGNEQLCTRTEENTATQRLYTATRAEENTATRNWSYQKQICVLVTVIFTILGGFLDAFFCTFKIDRK
jgi:hypothetical protein